MTFLDPPGGFGNTFSLVEYQDTILGFDYVESSSVWRFNATTFTTIGSLQPLPNAAFPYGFARDGDYIYMGSDYSPAIGVC
jgi:hypothetical protein